VPIKLSAIEEIYVETCNAYNRLANDGQGKAWVTVLGQYPVPLVKEAISQWQACTEPDPQDGEPVGSHFPTPADIKRRIELLNLGKQPKFRPCGVCLVGWVYLDSGRVRRCQCWKDFVASRAYA
jgi:hypothetical protein